MISVSHLRAFTAVVEVGTVTGAATAIFRTQPQVSRLISELAEEVGFPLFEREGRRLIISPRGARLYDEVKHVLETFDGVRGAADRIRNDTESELRILAPSYIALTVLPRALARYRRQFPTRNFSVDIAARNTVGTWLPHRSFDIGISALPIDFPSIKVKPFATMETLVVLPKGHPLCNKEVVSLNDLAHYPLVLPHRTAEIRKRLDIFFEKARLKPVIVGETTNGILACELVEEGVGLTLLNSLIPLTRKSQAIETRAWKPGSTTEFAFIYPQESSVSPAAEDFLKIIRYMFEELGATLLADE